ncbi:death domain-containing protein 1 [Arapaima gigas]
MSCLCHVATAIACRELGCSGFTSNSTSLGLLSSRLGHASCYVTAPVAMAQGLFCEEADDLSALLVSEREELVSRVLRIRHVGGATKTTSPLSVVLPFRVRYRCGHRDIMVKVIDEDRRASYVHPIATEGAYGGERGSFAEVRVYMLGLFAVVLCLRKEHFTVPTKGLSHRLSVDTRICLDYPPCCFPAPVVVQAMVQPMEGALLSALRSHCDAAQAVLSSSPLLYLSHPSPQPLCRPLTLTLPCPPGPDKRRPEEEAGSGQLASATPIGAMTLYNARVPSASVKLPASLSTEPLVLLGWREGQWMVLDDVAVRNAQNGLASFELVEHVERLIVFRLIPSARPSLLTSLMGDVEESSATTAVSLVLLQKQGEPQQAVVVAVLTRDLDGDLGRLCAEGYSNPSDPPPTVALREGEQLQLSFSGNITSTGHNSSATRRITFHKQRENRAFLTLCEVDEFGNYSSPHYRGTVIFHRVPKGRPTGCGNAHCDMVDRAALPPVCKLPVTLPKVCLAARRHTSLSSCDFPHCPVWGSLHTSAELLSDDILLWLAEELVEEDAASLLPRLGLRRGAVQRARQLSPDRLPDRLLHLLVLWRRSLPAIADKVHMLARHLSKCGRTDLSRELLLRRGGNREAQEKQATARGTL